MERLQLRLDEGLATALLLGKHRLSDRLLRLLHCFL